MYLGIKSRRNTFKMSNIDFFQQIPLIDHQSDWIQFAAQGIANAPVVCPGFGEPGWAPFCFLNGNPVFNAFDEFQMFIQNSVVSLHDTLTVNNKNNIIKLI